MWSKIGQRVIAVFAAVGSSVLVAMMGLIVLNIVVRSAGGAIRETYELVEAMIVVVVAAALGYTEVHRGHIAISGLVARFPPRVRTAVDIANALITVCVLALIVWASVGMVWERGFAEETLVTGIPYLPFRVVWILGALVFCGALVNHAVKALMRARS